MGNQIGLARIGGRRLKYLNPLRLGEQETLAAAAAHKKAGGALPQIALHHPVQRLTVHPALRVIGCDTGGVNTAQTLFGFHSRSPFHIMVMAVAKARCSLCFYFRRIFRRCKAFRHGKCDIFDGIWRKMGGLSRAIKNSPRDSFFVRCGGPRCSCLPALATKQKNRRNTAVSLFGGRWGTRTRDLCDVNAAL